MAIKAAAARQAPAGPRTQLRTSCQPWNACEHMQRDLLNPSLSTADTDTSRLPRRGACACKR